MRQFILLLFALVGAVGYSNAQDVSCDDVLLFTDFWTNDATAEQRLYRFDYSERTLTLALTLSSPVEEWAAIRITQVTWLPDRSGVIFRVDDGGGDAGWVWGSAGLYIMDCLGSTAIALTTREGVIFASYPAWSPVSIA